MAADHETSAKAFAEAERDEAVKQVKDSAASRLQAQSRITQLESDLTWSNTGVHHGGEAVDGPAATAHTRRCKKQTAVSHSCADSEIMSLGVDGYTSTASVGLRFRNIFALQCLEKH